MRDAIGFPEFLERGFGLIEHHERLVAKAADRHDLASWAPTKAIPSAKPEFQGDGEGFREAS